MYDLVEQIELYREFCLGAAAPILSSARRSDGSDTAYRYHGLKLLEFHHAQSEYAGGKIDMLLVDGPFRHLEGVWQFIPLADYACKVEFRLSRNFPARCWRKWSGQYSARSPLPLSMPLSNEQKRFTPDEFVF